MSSLAILISSIYIFGYILFKKEIDLYIIFLLLVPSILFATPVDDPSIEISNNFYTPLFSHFQNVLIIGPLALSTKLSLAFSIPVKTILNYRNKEFSRLKTSYFLLIFISVLGLIYSLFLGLTNSSGLTVGFRIALSIGAVLLVKLNTKSLHFYASLDKIIFTSVILLIVGIINAHWLFIVVGFIPYFWVRIRPRILILLPLLFSFNLLFNLSSTITILGTLFVSIIFFILIYSAKISSFILRKKAVIFLIIISPIIITVSTLYYKSNSNYDISTFGGYAKFKLIGDRKPIWDASFSQIINNSFFVLPAGTSLIVYFDYLGKYEEWPEGSHNIFLESGRQISFLGMLLIISIMITLLYKTGLKLRNKNDQLLYYCFISVYLVFGLTGNSLVYDGVGTFFWLLFGQFYQQLKTNDNGC